MSACQGPGTDQQAGAEDSPGTCRVLGAYVKHQDNSLKEISRNLRRASCCHASGDYQSRDSGLNCDLMCTAEVRDMSYKDNP
jgi:hypothetical protein